MIFLLAQCVMCSRTAAAQQAARAEIFNSAILFLGTISFCALAGFVYLVYRHR